EVFGGFGRNFVHPAVAAAVFLFVAWPAVTGGGAAIGGDGAIWGISVAAVILLWRGIASWRVLAGAALGAGLAMAVGGIVLHVAAAGAIAFGAVFLAADPVTTAATRPGRWIGGALFGALAVAITTANPAAAMLFAVLLTNVVTPTIDVVVIAANARRRARRTR
ncbi:MAG: RnfABCDGE type electron transport complex subunit D, partial [Proteobacteria bacterium]|nr:RnfABCDGE type electron transport complex subunit D [Pseudomonadota bacterium]